MRWIRRGRGQRLLPDWTQDGSDMSSVFIRPRTLRETAALQDLRWSSVTSLYNSYQRLSGNLLCVLLVCLLPWWERLKDVRHWLCHSVLSDQRSASVHFSHQSSDGAGRDTPLVYGFISNLVQVKTEGVSTLFTRPSSHRSLYSHILIICHQQHFRFSFLFTTEMSGGRREFVSSTLTGSYIESSQHIHSTNLVWDFVLRFVLLSVLSVTLLRLHSHWFLQHFVNPYLCRLQTEVVRAGTLKNRKSADNKKTLSFSVCLEWTDPRHRGWIMDEREAPRVQRCRSKEGEQCLAPHPLLNLPQHSSIISVYPLIIWLKIILEISFSFVLTFFTFIFLP